MTDQHMSPETAVLVDYANENLQLKIENARLLDRIRQLEAPANGKDEPDPADGWAQPAD